MRGVFGCRGALQGFLVTLLLVLGFSYCDDKSIEVVGIGECVDYLENNIKNSHASTGLHVAIDCKAGDGEMKTRGVGEVDEEGNFKINLPSYMVKGDGELKEECFAQLHSASHGPCPSHNGLDSSRIVFNSKDNGKHIFGAAGKLSFSPTTCVSAFLWPFPKLPHLPKTHPWHKPIPKFHLPPLKHFPFPPKAKFPHLPPKVFHHLTPKVLLPSPVPILKKPLQPIIPVFEKPLPPPVPIYKPQHVPVFKKPLPPPVPIFKKPLPPPVPIYKPPPVPEFEKPLPPSVPIFTKPLRPPVPIYTPHTT